MERKILTYLYRWQKDENRKPLLIYGNKQVGKTYTVLKFGENEYQNVVYFNTENNIELKEILKKEKVVDRLALRLAELSSETILKNETLIVFDNVNEVDVINGIRTFGKQQNDYHVILITSLRENLNKFKGEEFQFKSMQGMDFEEYLIAIGNPQLIEFIRTSFKNNSKMPFHSVAMEYYDEYLMTGGMPEAVDLSVKEKNKLLINTALDKVVDSYKKEISNQDNLIDITRSMEVLDSIPYQLQKSNRKFQYGFIKSGSRSKDYEQSINFLHNNFLVHKCYKVTDIKSPLSSCKDVESFKLYLNDTGVLFKMMHMNQSKLSNDYNLKSIFYENSIAINLINAGYGLYYYQSDGKAEVSFVIQTRTGQIIPIELVDKNMSKAKSLTLFMTKFKVNEAIRVYDENFKVKKGIKYVPIYALFCLNEIY